MLECQSLNLAFLNLAFIEFSKMICPLLVILHRGTLLDGRDPRAYGQARLTWRASSSKYACLLITRFYVCSFAHCYHSCLHRRIAQEVIWLALPEISEVCQIAGWHSFVWCEEESLTLHSITISGYQPTEWQYMSPGKWDEFGKLKACTHPSI